MWKINVSNGLLVIALEKACMDFVDHTCIKIHEVVGYT